MKKFAKLMLALALSAPLMNAALASSFSYGEPKNTMNTTGQNITTGYVVSYNPNAGYSYLVTSTFYNGNTPTKTFRNIPIYGQYPSSVITYTIDSGDTHVCVSAVTNDQFRTPVLEITCERPQPTRDLTLLNAIRIKKAAR